MLLIEKYSIAFQAHAICYRQMPLECDFGALRKIMLPPNALTIPRTELPMKQLLNIQGAHLEGFNQQRISFFFFFFFNGFTKPILFSSS